MPFDSEGNFLRLHNWEQDRLNDINIMSDRQDEEDDNFADGLSQCILRTGIAVMNGDLKMGNFQIKNLANGTATNDAVNKGQLDTGLSAKASDNAVVHLTSNETIAGVKTFTSEMHFSSGDNLTSIAQQNDGNFCIYKNNVPILTTGTSSNILMAPANQTTQQYSIVTTQYINSHCVKFSNGLMIQWGNSEYGGIINYPQPFANDDVVVTATIKAANGTNDNDAITFINSVGFNFHNYSGGGCLWTAFGHWY